MAILDPVDPEDIDPDLPVAEVDKTRTKAGEPVKGQGVGFDEAASNLAGAIIDPTQIAPMPGSFNKVGGGPGLIADVESGPSFSAARRFGPIIESISDAKKAAREGFQVAKEALTGKNRDEILGRVSNLLEDAPLLDTSPEKLVKKMEDNIRRTDTEALNSSDFSEIAGTRSEEAAGAFLPEFVVNQSNRLDRPKGTRIAAVDAESSADPRSTAIHEMTHSFSLSDTGSRLGTPLQSKKTEDIIVESFPNRDEISQSKITEMQAKLNELRFEIDPENPFREFDQFEVLDGIRSMGAHGNKKGQELLKAAGSDGKQNAPKNISNALNKLFQVAVGAGAASQFRSLKDSEENNGNS